MVARTKNFKNHIISAKQVNLSNIFLLLFVYRGSERKMVVFPYKTKPKFGRNQMGWEGLLLTTGQPKELILYTHLGLNKVKA